MIKSTITTSNFQKKNYLDKYFFLSGVEFCDKFLIKGPCVEFQECVGLALVLKQPYFCILKVKMLRWSVTDQQDHICVYFLKM